MGRRRLSEAGNTVTVWRTEAFTRLMARLDEILGGKTAKPLAAMKIHTVSDLMHHLPRRYMRGAQLSDLSRLRPGEEVAVIAEVLDFKAVNLPVHGRSRGRGKPRLEARITDHRGILNLAFFGSAPMIRYWQQQLNQGSRGIFAGKVKQYNSQLQLAHPQFVMMDATGAVVGGAKRNEVMAEVNQDRLIGLYPSSAKIQTWTIAHCCEMILQSLAGIKDPLPARVRLAAGVVDLETAFRAVHQPNSLDEVEPGRKRLQFDEAFSLQLTMARRRRDAAAHGAVARDHTSGGLLDAFDAGLPFTLTAGQQVVSAEIMADLARPHPMQRLLQGEVGAGKTVVALRAMLRVIDSGGQAALLAPTEVLAGQHLLTIQRLMGDLAEGGTLSAPDQATQVVLLTGSMSASAKKEALSRAASGEAGIVIGTHALLSAQVRFADLGLVVVDEQHRFGVEQRAALNAKAATRPHVLVMTATPIPRSVAMTVFGDLEVSTLREVPAGRLEVSTVVVDVRSRPAWVGRAWDRIREEVAQGRQAYIVCPRISADGSATVGGGVDDGPPRLDASLDDDQPAAPLTAVQDLWAELSAGPLAGLSVEMLHGQLPGDEKEAVMARFANGDTQVLVATTVVEVGVDVPGASIMVVCDADRFGISQLHQLRGRIGRGEHPGVCLLLTSVPPEAAAAERLATVASTRDGFRLADADLDQRREGDVLGASQSGVRSSLRLLRVLEDADVIARAREIALDCLDDDPHLKSSPGLADTVDQVELQAAGEWLERT